MTLWYERPAEQWVEANPIGNGRLGAMVFGHPAAERLQINEDTLWFGQPHDYAHEGAVDHLPEIRRLLFEGRQDDAERLAAEQFMSVPLRQAPYQPCVDLQLAMPGHENPDDYRRELDIDRAVSTVRYRVGEVTYTREVFASHPDDVIVVRISADRPGQVSFSATLRSPHEEISQVAAGPRQLALRGHVRKQHTPRHMAVENPLRFEVHVAVHARGGDHSVTGEGIEVTGADEAVLLLAAATNYVAFEDVSGDPAKRCVEAIKAASGKTYQELLDAHVADHQSLFRRVTLDLGATDTTNLPTDQRIARFAEGGDPQLAALYFQFGRYLLIASSRPGTQPANLQGIWNESTNPPWEASTRSTSTPR
jgi:alpha-L-fucosidase 2